jgi:hypothetical protein
LLLLFFPPLQGEASRHLPLAPSISKRLSRRSDRRTRRVIISWAPCCRGRGLRPSARAARRERARAARAAAARRRGRDDVTRRRCAAPLAASLRPASLRLLCPPALRARGADPRASAPLAGRTRRTRRRPARAVWSPRAAAAVALADCIFHCCVGLAASLAAVTAAASPSPSSPSPPSPPPSAPRRAADDLPVPGRLLPQGRATHRRGRAGLGGRLRGRTELYHPMARDHFSRVLPFLALPLVPRCLFLSLSLALWLAARLIALADAYPPHLAGLAEALRGIVLDAHRRDYPRGGVDGKCSERGRPRGRAARSATLCCVC